MANTLAQNPWTLDTASANNVWPVGAYVFIHHFEFIDYTVDADTATITDGNGTVVWKGNGAADLRPVSSGTIGKVNGLRLSAISAGVVRVYLK